MHLTGSCHCGSVRFSVESAQPVPFMRCYCSICRKTAGGGGYAVNLGADFNSLEVTGKRHLRVYRAQMSDPEGKPRQSTGHRHFCGRCGSALWLWDPTWPESLRVFRSCPLITPKHACSSLQMLAIARAMAALCA
jgi:hypothetical protein